MYRGGLVCFTDRQPVTGNMVLNLLRWGLSRFLVGIRHRGQNNGNADHFFKAQLTLQSGTSPKKPQRRFVFDKI